MSDGPGRFSDQFNLRLPDGMRDRLKAEAEANKRSMNAEIIARLENSLNNTDFFEHPILNLNNRKHLDRSSLVLAQTVIQELLAHLGVKPSDLPSHISENLESIEFMRNLVAHGPTRAENIREEKTSHYYGKSD
ncbi:hypothetical protein MRF4_17325 [Methylobacterium radiotolerans]|uniref:Arc family DNA-binding protein n=1 Tax=Methylobacterium TaxID=407 RepID=UPI002F33B8DD